MDAESLQLHHQLDIQVQNYFVILFGLCSGIKNILSILTIIISNSMNEHFKIIKKKYNFENIGFLHNTFCIILFHPVQRSTRAICLESSLERWRAFNTQVSIFKIYQIFFNKTINQILLEQHPMVFESRQSWCLYGKFG